MRLFVTQDIGKGSGAGSSPSRRLHHADGVDQVIVERVVGGDDQLSGAAVHT